MNKHLPTHRMVIVVYAFALCLTAAATADAQILSRHINSAPTVTSGQYVDIPGLFLTLPKQSGTQAAFALIILNVPQPYASGVDFPGLVFAIKVDTKVVAEGGFTYPLKVPPSFGRMPTTVVVRVPLTGSEQTVWALWRTVRNSKGHIDSFASLSAVIGP